MAYGFYNWCWTRHSMLNRETIDYSCDDMSKNIDYEAEMFGFYAIRKLAIRKSGSYTFKSIYRKEDYEQYKEKMLGKCCDNLQDVVNMLEELRSIEEDCLENIPESFVDTDRYSTLEENCDHLNDAISSVEEAISELEAIE